MAEPPGWWWPWYDRLVRSFGYDRGADAKAAQTLSGLLRGKTVPPSSLKSALSDRAVLVLGAGPSLDRDLRRLREASVLDGMVVVAADGAGEAVFDLAARSPDVVVTDLDGLGSRSLWELRRSLFVVHAHGGNVPSLERMVPSMGRLHGTTQGMPLRNVHNYGGFTDGDRCAFLADAYGARAVVLAGMDFGRRVGRYSRGSVPDEVKVRKFGFAKRLLEFLAERSDARLLNVTCGGVDIAGFGRCRPDQLARLLAAPKRARRGRPR